MTNIYSDPHSRYCESCSDYWRAETPMEFEEGRPAWEYCPDCIASLCVDCGLSACQDIHDGKGAGKHEFNDGVCKALVRYDPNFHKFTWSTVADAAEFALIMQCKRLRDQMQKTTQVFRETVDHIAA